MENSYPDFSVLLSEKPSAVARVKGSVMYPKIQGEVWFYQTDYGVLVVADIEGLPISADKCKSPIFAFHIHEGGSCTGNSQDPFFNVGMHYNPNTCMHPYHAGDLPPLFGANGYAFSAILSNRFTVEEVIGRSVVIHSSFDDFVSQPAGNSGIKIACGKIEGI